MNESVSYLIEASCFDCLDFSTLFRIFETAPRMMSSTPRGKGMGWASPKSFSGLDTRDCFGISLYILSMHFWLRKDQAFAALFGIHVALCFDGVLL